MKKILLAITTLLILSFSISACMQNPPTPEPPTVNPVKPQDVNDKNSCQSAGGEWKPQGILGNFGCVLPAKDAGKSCTDSSQCEYRCLAKPGDDFQMGQKAAGQCQVNSSYFGCNTEIKGGVAEPTLCMD